MKAKYIIKGMAKSIPGIEYIYHFNKNTGGTSNSRYCYSVWLRHLIYAFENGLTAIPKTVVELGPGDSLGTGIAALISGSENFYALDVKKYSNVENNLKIFDELVLLFKSKSAIPSGIEFPHIKPSLNDYSFPKSIFSDHYLNQVLTEERLRAIRKSISTINVSDSIIENKFIHYMVPWPSKDSIKNSSVDMVFSQAALQCVEDLENTYKRIAEWLKPNGIQSHCIEFKACGSSDKWFGHWEYSDLEWKIVKGRKSFYINRFPYSIHHNLIIGTNFKIMLEKKDLLYSNINRKNLDCRFREMSNDDLSTQSAFIQAKKII